MFPDLIYLCQLFLLIAKLTDIIYILCAGRDSGDSKRHFYQNLLAWNHNERGNVRERYISQPMRKCWDII
jgi:hypothetical protein